MTLTKDQEEYIKGYATALQDIQFKMTGDNYCAKHYDPCEFDSETLHSYAYDLKDGGRHHPLSDYKSVKEITYMMLMEIYEAIKQDAK